MKLVSFVSLILFLRSNFSFTTCCYDNEREALLSFKSHLTDPANRLSSWEGQNCCTWHGIKCSESLHVTIIDLQNPNPYSENLIINMNSELVSMSNSTSTTALNGTISPSLFSLTHLAYLDLSYNNFMTSSIPNGFANLTRLTFLSLSNAMFSGCITTQFSNLTLLRWLHISCSHVVPDFSSLAYNLTSSLEVNSGAQISDIYAGNLSLSTFNFFQGLHNLRHLALRGVDLSEASLSSHWANPLSALSNLQFLQLSNCKISGKVPAKQLLNLTNLSILSMNFNFLTSTIPNELANLTSLRALRFIESNLQGPIPYLPQLKELSVGNNSDIFINLHSMFAAPRPNLEILDISFTQIIGSLPISFTNTTSLLYFKASNSLLQGPIPASVSNLSNLETILLDYNNITGQVIPELTNLRKLKFLYMRQNSLEGSIPSSICNVSSIQDLVLGSNLLTGKLPDCISQMSNLQFLIVSSNNMNGTIPFSSLFKNSNLERIVLGFSGLTVEVDQNPLPSNFQPQYLDLRGCLLGGTIPDFISNLTLLTLLDLAHNNLSGTIPPWLFDRPNLGYLELSFNNVQGILPPRIKLNSFFGPTALLLAHNQLQGPIPPLLENIESLDLSRNSFIGNIPLQLELEKIRYLSFSGNKLHGQVPFSFCRSDNKLMLLDLSNNSLNGTVPTSLGNCTSLIFLNLRGNYLIGEVPNELESAKKLSYLDLTNNHFEGPYPDFILKLQGLGVLKLGHNTFQGKIPLSIGDLQNLRILVLESNFFNDSIPPEINKLEKLQYIDLSNNKLVGPIPERLNGLQMLRTRPRDGNILGYVISDMYAGVELDMVTKGLLQQFEVVRTYHSGIDLSLSSLTGTVPSEIGLLKGLYMFNLSHNQLSSEIPKTIGDMSGLESLDLSFKNLSGKIPITVTLLDSLSTFIFSYNNLSGKIPTGQHFDTLNIDGSAYLGNKFLCGAATGVRCDDSGSSGSERSVDFKDARQQKIFYTSLIIGYGVGLLGFLESLVC